MLPSERDTLRALAGTVRTYAELPVMAARRRLWYAHNALTPERPLILCFPEGAWDELLPHDTLVCTTPFARQIELDLRRKIYWAEQINDDNTLEPYFPLPWAVNPGDFGVHIEQTQGENRGSYVWDPPVKDLNTDLGKLQRRRPVVDRTATMEQAAQLNECFGDLLPVALGGTNCWWTCGLTWEAIKLIGLEQLMLAMYDNPDGLHRLMAWLRDEHLGFLQWCEREGLLAVNNRNGYTGSGGVAYTHELPQADWQPGTPARLKDLWGFAESQETVGVSPQMFAEFILPYQMPLLACFGLNCYGCCEAVHERWDYLKTIPRLRRVSISPWCDQHRMAAALGTNYVFSHKAHPAAICVSFDEAAILRDLRETRTIARDCVLEVIMKDTHTVQGQPWRITRWVELARAALTG